MCMFIYLFIYIHVCVFVYAHWQNCNIDQGFATISCQRAI